MTDNENNKWIQSKEGETERKQKQRKKKLYKS